MTEVWKTALHSTQKLVLLALADNANDQGECFPSISMLVQKCSLSDRAIQKAMGELESSNFLRRDIRTGQSTMYCITDPRTWFTPERTLPPELRSPPPRTTFTPERGSPPNDVHHTPEPRSPTPELRSPPGVNHVHPEPSEPSLNHQGTTKRAKPRAMALPDWLPAETWAMWDRYRQSLGRGWTDDAKRLSVVKLGKLRTDGYDPTVVVENAIQCGWRGIYPPKVERGGGAGNRRLDQQADVIRQLTTSSAESIDG